MKVKASEKEMSLATELIGKYSNKTETYDLTSLLGVHFYPQKNNFE